MEIPKTYDPKLTETKWYNFWLKNGYFKASPNPEKKPFTIVIPPPNVTAELHLGQALNNTIQDIFIRLHRLKGFETEWTPGVDHAGIATEVMVEKEKLAGKSKKEIGKEEFLKLVSRWAEDKKETIIEQLKLLGCSCDWDRTRFTLDPCLVNAVKTAFIRLYEKGLVYKGDYIVNWCPRCETAIADEEVETQNFASLLYYIKYPIKTQNSKLKTQNYLTVATTRPETMLGDTACAVNPKDKKNAKFIGKTVILPLVNREIPVMADEAVDPKFGTGVVKITPAHDRVDFEIAQRQGLPKILILNNQGMLNENCGEYKGLSITEARKEVIEDLKTQKLLIKTTPHQLALGHCYRCHTVIEPMLSRQWFVNQRELAKPAIKAVEDGTIKFFPDKWKGVYLNWMYNVKDWCISRQIWWGHQLPVFYCKHCIGERGGGTSGSSTSGTGSKSEIRTYLPRPETSPSGSGTAVRNPESEKGIIVSKEKPEKCPYCGSTDLVQEQDVLDTWFSSWLWPFSVFGWPEKTKDLDYFYPTSCLVTASEIIFFWVARMIMAGYEFIGEPPFKKVYIHGTVRDAIGRKMSKSLGNGIDPREVINKYGTDSLRFSLITAAGEGQDPHIQENTFVSGRDFMNKIWNAYRLISSLPDFQNPASSIPDARDRCGVQYPESLMQGTGVASSIQNLADQWILSRLAHLIEEVDTMLSKYKLQEPAMQIYDFFWHEFCDWYLEIAKLNSNKGVAETILNNSLILLHPFIPFITEEIWQKLSARGGSAFGGNVGAGLVPAQSSIAITSWPRVEKSWLNPKAEEDFELIKSIITTCRSTRAEMQIPRNKLLTLKITCLPTGSPDSRQECPSEAKEFIEKHQSWIKPLGKIETIEFITSTIGRARVGKCIKSLPRGIELFIPLSGLIDLKKEQERFEKEVKKINAIIKANRFKLNSPDFLSKAPSEVVERTKQKTEELQRKVEIFKANIELLKSESGL